MVVSTNKKGAAIAGAVCASAACLVGAVAVPESMQLTKVMRGFNWNNVPLAPIDFNIGIQELPQKSAQEVIKKHTSQHGSIAFVVRRPG